MSPVWTNRCALQPPITSVSELPSRQRSVAPGSRNLRYEGGAGPVDVA